MTREISKEEERRLLLKKIFPNPAAGYTHTLALFQICRELGDEYCLSFNENGYTTDYKSFDSDVVIDNTTKLLTDELLLRYTERFKDTLSAYIDFKGKFYTYDGKTKGLRLGSEWNEIKRLLRELFKGYGMDGIAILRACFEANVTHGKRWDNYYIVFTLAKKYGLGKGWFKILSELEIIGAILRHKGDISIPEELIPLITKVLREYGVPVGDPK